MHAQVRIAHALYLKVCAQVLRSGDSEAQAVAVRLMQQAEQIEQRAAGVAPDGGKQQ